ncbi:MAG: NeuD/PglB/VioB family sugar acetyltransferase [Selenomonadaceae bacterium]|nr:NeuD/PglB/VioB family sugar acetyltransferase [Selenomonadaceae bacterium]
MKQLVIYGAGAFADVFFYEVQQTKQAEIVAFAVDEEFMNGDNTHQGLPLVSFEKCDNIYSPKSYDMLVLCGYTKMRKREEMFNKAKNKGYSLPNYLSKNAVIEGGTVFGENNIVLSNVVLGHDGIMGDGNIIRQNTYIGHQFDIKSHTIVSAGVTIGGNCEVGSMTFIGLAATILNSKKVGNECLIGAGAVVTKDVEDYSKCIGSPARVCGSFRETGVILEN